MASKEFILGLYKKLHPNTGVNDIADLTKAELFEIDSIIDDKHTVILSSNWIPDRATADLKTLRNVLVSATLTCQARLEELNSRSVGNITDGDGHIDPVAATEWEEGIAYYQNQLDAIKLIEDDLLEPLRVATHEEGFYMQ